MNHQSARGGEAVKDKNGLLIDVGHDVHTPDGVGRVVGVRVHTVRVSLYKPGSVVFTEEPLCYYPSDVEIVGQSLQSKLREERVNR